MHLEIQDAGAGLNQTNGFRAVFRNTAGYAAVNIPLSFIWPFGKRHKMKLDLYGGARLEHSQRTVNGIGEAVAASQAGRIHLSNLYCLPLLPAGILLLCTSYDWHTEKH